VKITFKEFRGYFSKVSEIYPTGIFLGILLKPKKYILLNLQLKLL